MKNEETWGSCGERQKLALRLGAKLGKLCANFAAEVECI